MSELKNCAHCGSELLTDYSDAGYYPTDIPCTPSKEIQCDECKVIAPNRKAWNRRAAPWVSIHWPDKETLPCSFARNEYRKAPLILTRWVYRTECKIISGVMGSVIRRCKFIDNKFVFAKEEGLNGVLDPYVTHWMPIPLLPEA